MKKLSLIAAISLVALSSASNAATIYKKDGFTFKMDGDIQVQLRQRVGNNEDLHIDFDDSEIKNKISYDLGNGLTGFAEAHFDNGKDVNGAVESEETFVGLKTDAFKVQIGRMDYATSDFATERGIEEPTNESAFEAGTTDGSDVVLLEAKSGAVTFTLSHDLGDSARNTSLQSTDAYLDAKLNDNLSIGIATQSLKTAPGVEASNTNGANVRVKAGSVAFSADYSQTDSDASAANRVDLKVSNLSVAIPVAKTTKLSLGITNQSNAADNVADSWYANVVYKFPKAKKVSVFAEVQDTDAASASVGFLAGMRVKF